VELPGLDPSIQEVVQIVQSALSREQELENKLASMQEVLNAARQLATESMIVSSAVNSVPFEHCIFCVTVLLALSARTSCGWSYTARSLMGTLRESHIRRIQFPRNPWNTQCL